jgi:methylenetetrahydrofolate--tRNA-(uracil-5-)-methyltransferase
LAAIAIYDEIMGNEKKVFSDHTVCGALQTHISSPSKDFQPMNANFGILSPLPVRIKDKKQRYQALAELALAEMKTIAQK